MRVPHDSVRYPAGHRASSYLFRRQTQPVTMSGSYLAAPITAFWQWNRFSARTGTSNTSRGLCAL